MSLGSTLAGAAGAVVIVGGVLAGAAAIGWLGAENQLVMSRYFAPRQEQVRRDTFEQSQAFVEGQRRDIMSLRDDWLQATGDRRASIRALALERINGLPDSALSSQIVNFRNELSSAQ